MIRQVFTISRIDWRVVVYYGVDAIATDRIIADLERIGCAGDKLERARKNLESGSVNNGLTYSNFDTRESVMVIGITTSAEEFANTFAHEKGHLARHISQALHIDPYGEDEQYITGEIAGQMFKVAKSFLCENCRKHNAQAMNFARAFAL